MFTSLIALFVNHSAIGVGTVIGSEIFNHMIICAGSVMYSTTGVLQLEKRVFSRDVIAYFLSLIVLIWALKGESLCIDIFGLLTIRLRARKFIHIFNQNVQERRRREVPQRYSLSWNGLSSDVCTVCLRISELSTSSSLNWVTAYPTTNRH